MPRERDPNRNKAFEIYKEHNGNIDLVEIASQLNIPPGTVRGWKNKDDWNGTLGINTERSNKVKENKKTNERPIANEVIRVLENDDLTDKQRLFCLYYVKTFNATQSYLKVYKCSYETAMANGSDLLRNTKVREEIKRLKEIKIQQIAAGEEDLVDLHMRIAFADIGDYVSFGQEKVTVMTMFGPAKDKDGKEITEIVNRVRLKESTEVDTQLIKEVKEGKAGVGIKLIDRCKSLEWLDRYFLMNPMDKHKIDYDNKKLELAKAKANINEGGQTEDDGFIEALMGKVDDIWQKE